MCVEFTGSQGSHLVKLYLTVPLRIKAERGRAGGRVPRYYLDTDRTGHGRLENGFQDFFTALRDRNSPAEFIPPHVDTDAERIDNVLERRLVRAGNAPFL